MVYLDNAATTLIKPAAVSESTANAIKHLASPGRGGHSASMEAANKLYDCRENASKLFNVDLAEKIIFTSNATHALNIAISTFLKPGIRVVVSGYEHNAVMRPLFAAKARVRIASSPLFNRKKTLEAFKREIRNGADLVICTHVSNVFGFVLPIKEIGQLCRANRIPFIIDASQSAGSEKIDFSALGAEFIAMPGHKGLYGPQGTGILLCKNTGKPILYGGTGSASAKMEMPPFLPDRLEAGTHNMPGICGLSEGIRFVQKVKTEEIKSHEKELINLTYERLSKVSGIKLYYSENSNEQSGLISFNLQELSSEETAEKLGELEIAVRGGLHCSPTAHKTVGTYPKGTVRVSVSAFNTDSDIFALEDALKFITSKV